jgi:hypothetical protein
VGRANVRVEGRHPARGAKCIHPMLMGQQQFGGYGVSRDPVSSRVVGRVRGPRGVRLGVGESGEYRESRGDPF